MDSGKMDAIRRRTEPASRDCWWPASHPPAAADGHSVIVYSQNLDRALTEEQWSLLDAQETARAKRFVRPSDTKHFVHAHAALRRALGAWCGVDPKSLVFETGAYGKPSLQQAWGAAPVFFNLSHSGGIALIAISQRYELGIDVEMLRPVEEAIAREYFAPGEQLALRQWSGNAWLRGFFRCWTSKEALLKGEGRGLNLPLDAFEVSADPAHPPAVRAVEPRARIRAGWRLFDVQPAAGAAGTLALHDPEGMFDPAHLRCVQLQA